MARTTIRQTSFATVEVLGEDEWGYPIHLEISCPRQGGYLRFASGGQVCERLATRGPTLAVSDASHLLAVVRREWQARRRHARREMAR